MNEAELRDFAIRCTAAWCSHDPALVAGFYSPDGMLTINNGNPSIGREAIALAAQQFMTAFPDLQVLMDDLVVGSVGPEYHWTLIGTNTGPGGTGQRVQISGYEAWRLSDDGLIAASQGRFDEQKYERQLRGS